MVARWISSGMLASAQQSADAVERVARAAAVAGALALNTAADPPTAAKPSRTAWKASSTRTGRRAECAGRWQAVVGIQRGDADAGRQAG